jgi:alanine racemase
MLSKELSSTGLLTIDLGAIQYNWLYLKNKIQKANASARCAAVTKANAYGLDIVQVAPALMAVGCKEFFVATLNEAEELRKILGTKPNIFVLGGIIHGFNQGEAGERWSKFDLVPVIYDIEHIYKWLAFCKQQNKAYACALKVDTGMHRLGLSMDEIDKVLADIDANKNKFALFKPMVLMSHLACADDSENVLNQQQLSVFRLAAKKITNYFPGVSLSLSNSSAIFLDNQFHFDLCRPGIALYGGSPVSSHAAIGKNPMKQVASLSLPIMQIKMIKKGQSVGYGHTYTANKDMQLAVVFGGYADGILRSLSGRGFAWCNGVSIPMVGRVSMDSIFFDVTELNEKPDSVQIFNSNECLDSLAASAGTISYEILTSLGSRYQRQYINKKTAEDAFDILDASYDN